MEEMYIVVIGQGEYEDYYESKIFASFDKEKAEKWVDRFNKIVKDNKDRIMSYYNDDNWSKPNLFWHDFISYYSPIASFSSTKIR